MYTEEFQRWVKMGQQFNSPLTDLNKTFNNLCKNITQHQLNLLADNFSLVSEQLRRISRTNKPEEYLSLQKEIINEDINTVISNMYSMVRESLLQLEELGNLITDFNNQTTNISKNMAMKEKNTEKEKRKEKSNES